MHAAMMVAASAVFSFDLKNICLSLARIRADERRREKVIRQRVSRTQNGCASLVIRAHERRRLKAVRPELGAPQRRLGRGSAQEWPLV